MSGSHFTQTTLNLVFLRSVRRLLVAASVVPSSPILVTLMKEALGSFETSVFTIARSQKTPFFIVTAMKISNLTLLSTDSLSTVHRITRLRSTVSHGPHRKRLVNYCVFSRCRRNNMSTGEFCSDGCSTGDCLHSCYMKQSYMSQLLCVSYRFRNKQRIFTEAAEMA
jgi:hypothetical protein